MNLGESEFIYGDFIDKYSNLGHLEIDKIYDIKELAKTEGRIVANLESETKSYYEQEDKEMQKQLEEFQKEIEDKKLIMEKLIYFI